MNERSRNLIVGGTVLTGLVGFIFLLLVFGYLPRFLQTGYYVEIELEDAASVNPGSRVDLAGIDVGEVETIEFRDPFDGGVRVKARIKDDINIPASAVVEVEKELLGGSSTLKFVVHGNWPTPSAASSRWARTLPGSVTSGAGWGRSSTRFWVARLTPTPRGRWAARCG